MSKKRYEEEIARLEIARDYQRSEVERLSRYIDRLTAALLKIDKVQYEGYDAGDAWKVIREIIDGAVYSLEEPRPYPQENVTFRPPMMGDD